MSISPIELVLRPLPWQALSELQELAEDEREGALANYELKPGERAAVLNQLTLRAQAEDKLGEFARAMIFTRDGLEQATRLRVAAMHAARFKDAGITAVADLGCGIGIDSLAMASLGLRVRSWDINPEAVACTRVNLRFMSDCEANLGDVAALDIEHLISEGVQAIFADPARRTGAAAGGRRISSPEEWSPSLPLALSWREPLRKTGFDALGLKVAPGLAYEHIPPDFEANWVSVDGQLLEAGLWSPALQNHGSGRSATVIRGSEAFTFRQACNPSKPAKQLDSAGLGKYLWEPDPAIIRAGLIAQFVDNTALEGPISPSIAYLTSNEIVASREANALTGFEVLGVTQLRPKAISKALRQIEPTSVEVKKRGADINPTALQTALKRILAPRTDSYANPVTVIATRVDGQHRAVIARRLDL
ncbi:class I SAM-dependent methyltransferase [Gleimia europaea]|uniref:THUMP-like domain-containing protein n=1 Tax=Gleimia europaea ACS-120-V-Col10b TaxID=883069 RepID=A0A9W5REP0_9ACTO|nr:class I SAM-dependent methyltransferase [Gleimia europaea]EPD30976.1 hypothetical protein HMPREF9238_00732 [Gleimia europaea ACS-120-V-Col10b]